MATTTETMTIAELRDYRDETKSDEKYLLQVPSYQRGLVWPAAKKTGLISSIKRSFPIGALMFYETGEKRKNRKIIQVIDGLQRSTAILDYMETPLKIGNIVDDFLSPGVFTAIVQIFKDYGFAISEAQSKKKLSEWALETESFKIPKGFKSSKVREKFQEDFDELFSNELIAAFEHFVDEDILEALKEDHRKLSEYRIPVIFYSGDESNLPTIFESLNNGTPLTKYDKFAATWNSHQAITSNAKIRKFIHQRYMNYLEADWEVANFDQGVELGSDSLNLFEYLVGLGHLIGHDFPSLFSVADTKKEAPSWAFSIATVAHGLRLSEMHKLPEKVARLHDKVNLGAFEAALLDTCKSLNARLSEFLSLKLNMREDSDRFVPHSELQIQSVITRLLIEKYDPKDWSARSGVHQAAEILKNAQKHYVIDILREAWKGSGDSTMFERVWNVDEKDLLRAPHYVHSPTVDEMTAALADFHAAELQKLQKERPNVSARTKMLLRVLYADKVTFLDNKTVQFDIEHLYPVKQLADFAVTNGLMGLPISSFGNLAILPRPDNIIKGKNFIGDYIAEHAITPEKKSKLTQYVISPELELITAASFVSKDSYEAFCKARFQEQSQAIVDFLFKG